MTSRERVLAVLNRKTPDRIPFDIGGTGCSSIHIIAYKKLRDYLGLPPKSIKCACLTQLIAELDDDMRDMLRIDTESLMFGSQDVKIWKTHFGLDLIIPQKFDIQKLPDGATVARNPEGTVYSKMASDSYYFDPVGIPLSGISSPAGLDRFNTLFDRWDYSYVYDEPVETLAQRAQKQYQSTTKAVIVSWNLHYLQSGQLMRGYEQFFIDLMIDKNMVHAILQKLHQVYLQRIETFLSAFSDFFDVVFLTDDLGTQQSALISPATYKEMVFPYISEIVARIKSYNKKIIMHSCGAVSDFIPSLIEMGVDALNPVQISANGMNPAKLVKEYGKDIAFWGGGCDTQNALNASDPEIVRADVRRRLQEFGTESSLVFTQVHNIQYDVPPENIFAMQDEFFKQIKI